MIDIQDGHSCSSLELEAVGLRSISFFVPSLVKFSSRDLKVLIMSILQHSVTEHFYIGLDQLNQLSAALRSRSAAES